MASHRLAAYRADRDYSLSEVAWKLRELSRAIDGIDSGPTVKTVWRWERGSLPTCRYRRLLCRLYGATAAELGFNSTERVVDTHRGVVPPVEPQLKSRHDLLEAIATVAAASGLLKRGAAERAAIVAGDGQLVARVRYSQARQFQPTRHDRDALETLRLAHTQLGAEATPAIGAMLHGAEASSLAALGDRRAALAALARACVRARSMSASIRSASPRGCVSTAVANCLPNTAASTVTLPAAIANTLCV